MSGRKFPASVRMRNRSEIREVFTQGRFRPLGPIGAKYLRTSHPECRFLVTVKKNVGNAPVRNRIKRLLREGLRHHRRDFEIPHDICLMVTRPPKLPLEFSYVNGLISQLAEDLNHHPKTISPFSQND